MLNKILLNVFIFFGVSYSSLYIKEKVIWFEVIHKYALVLLNPPTTYPPTTDHLPTDPPTTDQPTHRPQTNQPTDPTIIDPPITLCLKDSKIRHSYTDANTAGKMENYTSGYYLFEYIWKLYFGLLSIWILSKSLIEFFVFIEHLCIC